MRVDLSTRTISTIDGEYENSGRARHQPGGVLQSSATGFRSRPSTGTSSVMIAPLFQHSCRLGAVRVRGWGRLYPVSGSPQQLRGRFTAIKFAGWDGIVVQGARTTVWINIVNDKVTIERQGDLRMDTWTPEEISRRVMPGLKYGGVGRAGQDRRPPSPRRGLLRPGGERQSRLGALLHGPRSQAACAGSGVFGSKLKAISAIGTGDVDRRQGLHGRRLWFRQFNGTWTIPARRNASAPAYA